LVSFFQVVRKVEDEDAVQYGDAAVAAASVKRVKGSMSALAGGEGKRQSQACYKQVLIGSTTTKES